MSMFDCDINKILSTTCSVDRKTEHGDGSFSTTFYIKTELRIPITPDDELMFEILGEGVCIYVNMEGGWLKVGSISREKWPVPSGQSCVISCVLPDPIKPKMKVIW